MGFGQRGIGRHVLAAVALTAIAPAAAEAAPKLKILDATAIEGAEMTFTVKLKPASDKKVTVAFETSDGTAGAADYVAASGKAKLKPGAKKTKIAAAGLGDTIDEPEETFTVGLSNARGAKIADGEATGRIGDDDAPAPDASPGTPDPDPPATVLPVLSIGSASVAEGNPPDPSTVGPSISLSAPSTETVSATFTAVPGDDIATTTGTVTLPPGTTSADLDLGVTRDFLAEADEPITVTLSGSVNATASPTPGTLMLLDDDAGVGELVITELLPNPAGTGQDAVKEFVEFVNLGAGPVNLSGFDLGPFPAPDCALTGTVAAGDYFVVSNDPLIRDAACPALTLSNSSADSISLFESSTLFDAVPFNGSDDGISLSLDPDHRNTIDNDSALNFCDGTDLYDGLNRGTPGAANAACP